MARPATSALGEAVYAHLGPVAVQDEPLGWPLLTLVQALAEMGRQVEDLVRPDDPDRRAWDPLLDVDLSPDWNLPYIGQYVGVRVTPGGTPAQWRAQIRGVGGFKRGTVAAMREAVRATLTGTQFVDIIERDGDPWHITVTTRSAETPNPAAALAAAMSQKAAGLILTMVNTATIIYTEAEFRWGALPAANVEAMFATGNDAEAVV
jgi:hypothetical protein